MSKVKIKWKQLNNSPIILQLTFEGLSEELPKQYDEDEYHG